MSITPEAAAALRKPFDKKVVGKLPKPLYKDSKRDNCRECGGYHGLPAVHLDYVGHAATTDRLLAVDPGWSWEPMATDEQGLPALDRKGNLWIRLTVCGVTRIGVGDGGSAKECIGDAIRNAAMRFGVALDLWSKEELEQAHGPAAQAPTTAPRQTDAAPESPLLNTSSDLAKAMYASMRDAGFSKDDASGIYQRVTGREGITSSSQLTDADAREVLRYLDQLRRTDTTTGVIDDEPVDAKLVDVAS